MLTPISTKIEEFKEKFLNPNKNDSSTPINPVYMNGGIGRMTEEIETFLRTALEQRDNEWRELVGYVRENAEDCAVLARENESHNIRNNIIRPIDDIINKSKEK